MFVYQRVSDSRKNRMKQRATIRACPAFDVSSLLQSGKKTPTFQAFTRCPARSLPEQSRNFKVRWPICARTAHGTALAGGSSDLVGVYNQQNCFEIRQPENIGKNWDDRRARSFVYLTTNGYNFNTKQLRSAAIFTRISATDCSF